ncbi:MAG: PLP-dependent aminotransferase family protein [Acidobacteriaceae bacterium]|nr:PLP-dependent aminotransferase family protein [Acidobacteriaceae bacterium]
MEILSHISLDSALELPIYKQLADSIRAAIEVGAIGLGERLPATRELAGQLGLNRTTVSAAYSVLEEAGLLEGQVGRGSFVAYNGASTIARSFDWEKVLPPPESINAASGEAKINFANSRPSEDCFPMEEFRRLSREVIQSREAVDILQLGSPYGYGPLRRYLLNENLAMGLARAEDDLIITNGCQQALDLLARLLVGGSDAEVLLEEPVYHGLLRVFASARARLIPVPVGDSGVNVSALEAIASQQQKTRLLVITPDFQNPTGTSLNLEQRKSIVAIAQRAGWMVIESTIYRDLRYRGQALPTLKQLDESGNVISIGSYSKVAFPGLRVGWVIASRPVVARLAEAKQTSDLHSDQLSQAVLLRFAESGELARHLERTKHMGTERLRAVLESCERFLPAGCRFTRPEGGMNLWVELPPPLLAEELLKAAEEQEVSFLPGGYFSHRRSDPRHLRISFGGLSPETIRLGMGILGTIARDQIAAHQERAPLESFAALV